MRKTVIVCGFPGVGKSRYCTSGTDLRVLDLESSDFSNIRFWPDNYLSYIQQTVGKNEYDVIFISSHDVVRHGLMEMGIPFVVATPEPWEKKKYIARYKNRGDSLEFIQLLDDNWDKWLSDINKETRVFGTRVIWLANDETLSSERVDRLLHLLVRVERGKTGGT